MAVGIDLFENVLNFALGANDERGPRDAPDLLAVHVFLFHHAEGFGDFLVGVGQQSEREVVLLGKTLLRLGRVGGDAKQHGAGFLNLFI